MLDKLFSGGLGVTGDHISDAMMWRWAEAHPLLFTVIKVTEPYLFVIIAVVGINIINRIFGRGR